MPVYFWNDDAAGSRYFNGYFEKYDNVWTHGDFIVIHPVTKNVTFLGRADGVLNPSGVRFGSAEIYSVIDAGFPMVSDAICVGQRRKGDEDERVMLFLLMKEGERFNEGLVRDVKAAIRKELSSRLVPKYIFETPAIPVSLHFFSGILMRKSVLIFFADDGESEESRVARETDRIREGDQTKWHASESRVLGLLLSVCQS